MPEAMVKSQEELNRFVVEARGQLAQIPGLQERTAKAEQLADQLKVQLDEVKRSQLEQSTRPAEPDDVSIERAYTLPTADRQALKVRGGVADASNREAGGPQRRWLRSKGGAVRLLGGVERGRWACGLLDDPAPKSDWQKEAQQRAEEIAWVKAYNGRASDDLWQGFREHMCAGPAAVAKVFSDNPGEGGEFIVTIPMTMLERTAEMARLLEGQLKTLEMPATTVTMPFLTTGVQPFMHGVPAAGDNNPGVLPKSVPSTAERTLTAKTLTVNVPIDRDSLEDSIIAAIPLLQQLVGEALRDGTEDALINGDSAAVHGDTAFASWNPRSRWQVVGSALDHRKPWIGWRQRAFDVDASVATAATDYNLSQTVADYIGALAGLTVPHAFGDIVYITSPEHYLKKILVDPNLLTVDKYGANAVLLTGEVGRIGGHPLVLSEFVTADLASSGLYTGSGATTSMLIVNLARFLMGRRRSLRIEVETVVREHTVYVVASERKVLHTFDGNTVANVRNLFNLSS